MALSIRLSLQTTCFQQKNLVFKQFIEVPSQIVLVQSCLT